MRMTRISTAAWQEDAGLVTSNRSRWIPMLDGQLLCRNEFAHGNKTPGPRHPTGAERLCCPAPVGGNRDVRLGVPNRERMETSLVAPIVERAIRIVMDADEANAPRVQGIR